MKTPRGIIVSSVFIYAFMLVPMVFVLWISVFRSALITFPPAAYSLKWYGSLPSNTPMMSGLVYSLEIAFLAAAITMVLAFFGAMSIARSQSRTALALADMFLLPLSIPIIITGMALFAYFWSISQSVALGQVPSTWMLLAGHVMITLPWGFRLIYAGVTGLDETIERASLDLGCNVWQTFYKVTLPLVRPSVVAGAIFAFIISFGTLEISLFLVSPGVTTLPVAIMNYIYYHIDPSIAAVATVEMAVVALLMVVADRFLGLASGFQVR